MQQKRFNQSGVVDADQYYAPPRKNIDPSTGKIKALATLIIGSAISLLTFIVMVSLLLSNYHLFIGSMSLLLQFIVWSVLIGVPLFIGCALTVKTINGVLRIVHEANGFLDQRAERLRLNALNAAEAERIRAEAEEIRARAIACMRSVNFDANGNAAIIGVSVDDVHQLRGQIAQPRAMKEQQALPEHAESTKQAIAPTFEEAVRAIERNSYHIYLGKSLTEFDTDIKADLLGNHMLIIGTTQMGKSCEACMIMDQVTRTHDTEHLQIALLDLEDLNCNLFSDLPHVARYQVGERSVKAVARSATEVAKHMTYLVRLMDERYQLGPKERGKLPRILIYIEEFIELKRRLKGEDLQAMADNFTSLATRGLKANMHLMVCAQASYSQEEFREAMGQLVGINLAFCARPKLAQAAGFMNYELLNQNYLSRKKGQFVIEATGQSDIAIAVEYNLKDKLLAKQDEEEEEISARVQVQEVQERPHLYAINGGAHPSRTLPAPDECAPSAPAWEAYIDVIERLQREEGKNQDEIIEKVFHRKKGGNPGYYEAREIYRACDKAIKARKENGE